MWTRTYNAALSILSRQRSRCNATGAIGSHETHPSGTKTFTSPTRSTIHIRSRRVQDALSRPWPIFCQVDNVIILSRLRRHRSNYPSRKHGVGAGVFSRLVLLFSVVFEIGQTQNGPEFCAVLGSVAKICASVSKFRTWFYAHRYCMRLSLAIYQQKRKEYMGVDVRSRVWTSMVNKAEYLSPCIRTRYCNYLVRCVFRCACTFTFLLSSEPWDFPAQFLYPIMTGISPPFSRNGPIHFHKIPRFLKKIIFHFFFLFCCFSRHRDIRLNNLRTYAK